MRPREFATPADLALCRQMIRQGSKSFHLASLLLPDRYREHARALYGFCRMADDCIDEAKDAEQALNALSQRLDCIYAGNPSDNPADRAFANVVHRFSIPRQVADALLEGFAWDAQGRSYRTVSEVTAYAVRVAGTVGVMMSLIMGERRPQALARAIDLGVAMQFSNIVRDVADDASMGRVYLPADLLAAGGTTPSALLENNLVGREAAKHLIAEAERLYARSATGIAMLPLSCRASINAARLLYREIGLEAGRIRHGGRAVVPLRRKLLLVARAVAATPWLSSAAGESCLQEGAFLLQAVSAAPAPAPALKGLSDQLTWAMELLVTVEGRKS